MSSDAPDPRVEQPDAAVAATLSVTVYSTPVCMQCKATYRELEKSAIPFTIVDVSQNEAARTWVMEDLGYSQAPIVIVDQDPENHWSGFRPDRIKKLSAIASRGRP